MDITVLAVETAAGKCGLLSCYASPRSCSTVNLANDDFEDWKAARCLEDAAARGTGMRTVCPQLVDFDPHVLGFSGQCWRC